MDNTQDGLDEDTDGHESRRGKQFPVIGVVAGREDVAIQKRLVVDAHASDGLGDNGEAAEEGEDEEAGEDPKREAIGGVVDVYVVGEVGIWI